MLTGNPGENEVARVDAREVWLATYIFHDDPAATALAVALKEAAGRGVAVHVVVVVVWRVWIVTIHEHAQPCGSCGSALATGGNSPMFIPSQTV